MVEPNIPPQSFYGIGREALYPQEQMVNVKSNNKRFSIGIPADDQNRETRIPITPQGVGLLVENGHEVYIERGAGLAANFSDADYSEVGAQIVETKNEAFNKDVVVKVTLPQEEDICLLKERAILFSNLNLSGLDVKIVRKIMDKKVTAVALDLVADENGIFPIVRSLSEIEGIVAINTAAKYLSISNGGKGVLLGGVTGISPTEVVILGAGTAGTVAARTAIGMGSVVKVFDYSISKLRDLDNNLGHRVFTSNLHPNVLSKALKSADVVIGTLRFLYGSRRFMVTEELIQLMKPGAVIIDLSIDQGGCFETSHCTTIKEPDYEVFRVKHICLPGISVLVPRTASIAFSNIVSQLLLEMGERNGIMDFIKYDKGFSSGVYVYQGILTNHYIGAQYNLPSKDIGLLMAAF